MLKTKEKNQQKEQNQNNMGLKYVDFVKELSDYELRQCVKDITSLDDGIQLPENSKLHELKDIINETLDQPTYLPFIIDRIIHDEIITRFINQ